MRASKARQVTATTCPLVDIQRSFCSRSASGYFVGNLPQKVKLVNGLNPRSAHPRGTRCFGDIPGRARIPTRICYFFPRSIGHLSAVSAAISGDFTSWTSLTSPRPWRSGGLQSWSILERTGYKHRFWLDMPRRDCGLASYNAQNPRDAAARANPTGRFKRAPRVSDSIDRVGSSTATCLRNGTQARSWRSKPVLRGENHMPTWTPDPSFYPSPRQAAKAPPESLAYVAAFDPDRKSPDRIAVVDVDPKSSSYSKIIGNVAATEVGDEFHHFGWNACSSCLCPNAPHPHVERRYLVVPSLRSSRIYILDTKPDPRAPKIVKVIEPAELADKTGYTRPHTVHCGPGGIYVAALGNKDGKAPGGVFVMDHESFEPLGRWEVDRGSQQLGYDAWWHLGYDTMVTSEWGTPDTFENGLVPEILLGSKYGRRLHFWDFTKRTHLQEIDFGEEHQLVFELRPAHDPTKAHGFVNCVISLKDLSSSIWTWFREGNKWAAKKIISIPAEPANPDDLPPVLKGFKAVPPLVTDIDLSMDDRFLYVACWGTG